MSSATGFFTSSVGRKLLMGLSGLFLCSFLVVHLYINLFLLAGDRGETFDAYAEFMATYPLLRPLEIVLFLGFLLHAIVGAWLWFLNRRARPARYRLLRVGETSELSSRVTMWTGLAIFAFLIFHVNAFFVQSRFFPAGRTMYQIVAAAFADPWTDALYVAALFFLGYHLRHGFQSSVQTFGLRLPRYQWLIDAIGVFFWLLIPLGFAMLPLYFLWVH